MSWRVPELRPKNGDATNVEVFDSIAPYAEEVGGKLNEHNWKAAAFSSRTHLEEDASMQYAHASEGVATEWDYGDVTTAPQDTTRLQTTVGRWVPVIIDDAPLKTTITTGRGTLWATASFQVFTTDASTSQLVDWYIGAGHKWTLAVDGVVQEHFACGGDANVKEDGMQDIIYSVLIDAFVPVDPGPHTIEVMVFIVPNYPVSANVSDLDKYPEVHSYDLITRELRS